MSQYWNLSVLSGNQREFGESLKSQNSSRNLKKHEIDIVKKLILRKN